jgi:hypothetical protein
MGGTLIAVVPTDRVEHATFEHGTLDCQKRLEGD